MHNNYFLLRQLVPQLREKLKGLAVKSIFSQNKDELVLIFGNGSATFAIRARTGSAFTCLSFPADFRRARKNSADLFGPLTGHRVTDIRNFSYDRSFAIDFEEDFSMIFKLHGNRSNILLFEGRTCVDIFRKNLKKDCELKPDEFGKSLSLTQETFRACGYDYNKFLPVLGKSFKPYFDERDYSGKTPEEKWETIQEILKLLNHPEYHISMEDGIPVFRLYRDRNTRQSYTDPVEALNAFCGSYNRLTALQHEKSALIRALRSEMKRNRNYIGKTEKKLLGLKSGTSEAQTADIIMANLQRIPSHAKEITLFSFYDNKEITIKLKPHLSPQKNAEVYYRKSKNKRIEAENLRAALRARNARNEEIEKLLENVEQIRDLRSLRRLAGENRKAKTTSAGHEEVYHTFPYRGYQILVGKNAKKNDVLTFKTAHKNDLWLHVRDAPGSHVIIRQQPGGNIPKAVIQRAAALAAFYSKRKGEAVCPVMYTERKFVRKTRDLAPGEVIVDREKTLLVQPQGF